MLERPLSSPQTRTYHENTVGLYPLTIAQNSPKIRDLGYSIVGSIARRELAVLQKHRMGVSGGTTST
jgi:hypothetical protein